MAKDTVVDVEGKHLKLSNLDKVYIPRRDSPRAR